MEPLFSERCAPCRAGAAPASEKERREFMTQLPDWRIEEGEVPELVRVYSFGDYRQALDFVSQLGRLAQDEDHHPAILLEWGQVTVRWSTHKIKNLHRNDFVMAAKSDQLYLVAVGKAKNERMNPYAALIVTTLVLIYLINGAADLFNLKALRPEIPPEFQGLYDPEAYRKSQEYTRVKTRFGLIVSSVDLAKVLLFWVLGGFNALDVWLRGWGWPMIPTGLAYTGLLLLANEILSLPFALYGTFVVEERFGFNKTTLRTFIADRLKAYLLTALIGGALLAGVLAFLQSAGAAAWVYIWAVAAAFVVGLQFIAPTWLMPLFNKFTPLGEGELKNAILDYARSVDFPLQGIYVMDGSKRSTKANAFFTGFGRNKRIALFDTLIEKHSVPELVAVLAHEIGHYKMKHILKSMVLSLLQLGVLSYLLSLFINSPRLFAAFHMDNVSPYAGLIIFSLLYTPLSFVLSVFLHMFSRRNEFEADRYAVQTYHKPDSLAQALKVLSVTTLSNLEPHAFYAFLNYTHPPVLERIRAIQKAAAAR